ncbi:MAG: porin family protein [Prevotellaceae bacterium]|jgi:outer membrane protein X|nr:porin family protein [Prevotellaceae bacterium]
MKKFLFIAVLFCGVALSAQSQEFKPFRVDMGLGYGLPFTDGLDGGVQFYVEPKYEIIPQIAVGLRWEGSLFAGSKDDEGNSVDVKLSSAYMVTGDYYLTNNKFRPFVGLGLGIYSVGGVSVDDNTETDDVFEGKSNFGALLRAGFDISHFRFALSYTYGGKINDETFHFFGITVGFYLGGGKN